ncbi:MAG: GreA/GreB family elongation factor [Phycisphaerales bacterium]|nr:GreA/GreB family elongation factor [Phycisphaerales bacterium]
MPETELQRLAEAGDLDAFETRCIELLEGGRLGYTSVAGPLGYLAKSGQTARAAQIAKMILDNADTAHEPMAALRVARVSLEADPNNAALRERVADLFEKSHAERAGVQGVIEGSGIRSGRPIRAALRYLDTCMALKPGSTLLARSDNHAAEVTDVDLVGGMISLKRPGRGMTMPLVELVREYDMVAPDDFRVMRQLWPDKLGEMISKDPVAVVIGLIHAHGEQIDSDTLKSELVPRYLPEKDWTKWWSNARTLMKRSPNVILEGRSPVIMKYTAAGQSLEEETWQKFTSRKDPLDWLDALEDYLREKAKWKEPPSVDLLGRMEQFLLEYAHKVVAKRPAESLACGLLVDRAAQSPDGSQAGRQVAMELLKNARDAASLIARLEGNVFWEPALKLLETARPGDARDVFVALVPRAPAGMLETVVGSALRLGAGESVQQHIDAAMREPLSNAEILHWLWRGTDHSSAIKPPAPHDLLTLIIDTLSGLGRTIQADSDVTKQFRARMKSALGSRDFASVKSCFLKMDAARAIVVRSQLERLEGLGDNTQDALISAMREAHPHLWVKAAGPKIATWEDTTVVYTSASGLRKRSDERDHLVNVEMRDNARRIGEAAALGDLSENSEYKFALEERDLLRARLAQINNELTIARVLEPGEVSTDRVDIGTRVTLRNTANGDVRQMTILGPFDANLEHGIYNYKAPVCQKLLGRRVGDKATIAIAGEDAEYEIIEIANGLVG